MRGGPRNVQSPAQLQSARLSIQGGPKSEPLTEFSLNRVEHSCRMWLNVSPNFEFTRKIRISAVCIKYSICDVINYCVQSCDLGEMSVCDQIVIENLKKDEKWR